MNQDDLLRRLNEQNRQQAQARQPQGGLGDTLLSLLPFGTIAQKAITGQEITPGEVALEAGLTFLPIGKLAKGAFTAAKGGKKAAKAVKTDNLPTSKQLLGKASVGSAYKSAADSAKKQASYATRQNELSTQFIKNLARERATQGPLLPGGGIMLQPGKVPSFATEGIEKLKVPSIPTVPERYSGTLGKASAPEISAKQSPQTFLERTASRATQAGSGLKIGGGVGDLARTEEAAQLFAKHGIVGTPREQLPKIDQAVNMLGNQVDTILEKSPVKLSGNTVASTVRQAIADPTNQKYADIVINTPAAQKALDAHLEKIATATTAKDINDYIKVINPTARRAQQKIYDGKGVTEREMAALAVKKAGDEVLTQIPAIAPLKKEMAIFFERNPEVATLSQQKTSIPFPLLSGLQSQGLKQGIANVESRAGAALGQGIAGEATDPSLLRTLAGQAGRRVGADVLGLRQAVAAPEQPVDATGAPSDLLAAESTGMTPDQMIGGEQQQDPTQQYYEAAQRAIEAGDPKAASQLMKFAEDSASIQKALTPKETDSAAKASNALAALDQVERLYQEAGGGQGLIGYGQKALAGARMSPDVEAFENMRQSAAVQLARALGETGPLSNQDITMYARMIPDSTNTAEAAKKQLDTLRIMLSQAQPTSGADGLLQQLNARQTY